jgi:glutathione S-transferase
MLLVIGNKNYSSWSLRSWIALKMLGVPVDKKRIALRRPETKAEILRYSSAGRVPILRDGDTVVWGSLAILEYLAEKRPQLWPSDPAQRAKARSVAAVRRDPRERAACLTTLAECPLLADSRHVGKRPRADVRRRMASRYRLVNAVSPSRILSRIHRCAGS